MTEEQSKKTFLPLGSIVIVQGTVQKMIIIARGIFVQDKEQYFDYGAFLYPQGLFRDSLTYFNESQISKMVFKGYSDEDDELYVGYIDEALERFQNQEQGTVITTNVENEEPSKGETIIYDDDPFADLRDMEV